jgi:hypothetical protein
MEGKHWGRGRFLADYQLIMLSKIQYIYNNATELYKIFIARINISHHIISEFSLQIVLYHSRYPVVDGKCLKVC